MKIETITTRHPVKGEDLNHYDTLYAGRGAEFISASSLVGDEHALLDDLRYNESNEN
jgi:hypothetical protein